MINERYDASAPIAAYPARSPAQDPVERPRRWYPSALVALGWHLLLGALVAPLAGLGPAEGSQTGLYIVVVLAVPYLLASLVIALLLCLLVRTRHLLMAVFHGTWTTGAGLLGAVVVMGIAYDVWSSTRR